METGLVFEMKLINLALTPDRRRLTPGRIKYSNDSLLKSLHATKDIIIRGNEG